MGFFSRKLKKQKVLEKKDVEATVQQELAPYIRREELRGQLIEIENTKKRHEKLGVLLKYIGKHPRAGKAFLMKHPKLRDELRRYMAEKKGGQDGKK